MSELVNILDATRVTPPTDMPLVELFDPPMCCPTGLCGPALDQTLLSVNEMVISLAAEGVPVARYQMTSHPQAFLQNAEVLRLIREQEMAALPITLVGGKLIKAGEYPTLAEVRQALRQLKGLSQ